MNVPTMADMMAQGKQPEVLFWVGAAGSYDDRAKKITKAFVKILNMANVDFAVLGTEESSTGDAAKIIKETNAGSISDFNDVTTLVENIKTYYLAYKQNNLSVNSKDYEKYSRKLLAGAIAEELNKIAN